MDTPKSVLESEKYHVIRELGRGGMGVVYLAEDKRLMREVALKILYEHLNRETNFVARFQEEARAVSTLHHPNIVCVHGLEQANDVVAIDMEYVDGHSLDKLAAEVHLTPHIIVAIARDVLRGLVTCHDIGVVHRDIKPSNILVHLDGTAKITDFGLATAYASHLEATVKGSTSSGFYMGTPRYMPVDAWEGGEPKPAWDTYALGVVLFELLSGKVAYPGDNPIAIMKRHLSGPLAPTSSVTEGLSPELSDLVDALIGSANSESTLTSLAALELLQATPEFDELHDSNVTHTVAIPRARRVRSRIAQSRFRNAAGYYRAFGVFALGLMGLLAYLYVSQRNDITPPDEILTDNPSTIAPQPEPGAPQIMTMSAIGTGAQNESWLVEENVGDGTLQILGFSPIGFTRLIGTPASNGNWSLQGGWAESLLPQAGSTQFGEVTGTLQWLNRQADMHVRLDRIRTRDLVTQSYSFAGRPTTTFPNREAFLRQFESAEILQAMLYSELLTRSELQWPKDTEAMLPALSGARYLIPFDARSPKVDGNLDEAFWTEAHFSPGQGRIGDIKARQGNSNLWVRWNGETVSIAARTMLGAPDLQFEIALLPAFEVSLENSGRFSMSMTELDGPVFSYYLGGVEQPSKFQWPVKVADSGNMRTVEMAIPREILNENACPKAGKRWRLNAQWFREGPDNTREIVAQWGDPSPMALEHGTLFVFTDNSEAALVR